MALINMAQHALLEYGQGLLPLCKPKRYFGKLSSDINDPKQVLAEIATLLSLTDYHDIWIERTTTKGFSMKWHCDDAAVLKTKIHKTCGTMIAPHFKLYHKKNLPIYSAIIYASDYGVDFTGGEFEFVDDRILPRRHYVLCFDSREVHRVLPVTSGERKTILIKFYSN